MKEHVNMDIRNHMADRQSSFLRSFNELADTAPRSLSKMVRNSRQQKGSAGGLRWLGVALRGLSHLMKDLKEFMTDSIRLRRSELINWKGKIERLVSLPKNETTKCFFGLEEDGKYL